LLARPGGPTDYPWTKDLVASGDGKLLYVGRGLNGNVAENGLKAEQDRAGDFGSRPLPAAGARSRAAAQSE
jgi:glucose/arabinose dehydrogenase